MYLVLTTTRDCAPDGTVIHSSFADNYETVETYEDAQKLYKLALGKDNLYCAHICVSVDSTDYDTVPESIKTAITTTTQG